LCLSLNVFILIPLFYLAANNLNEQIYNDGHSTFWTFSEASRFVWLLNQFYRDTGFGEFFEANMEYYQSLSADFYKDVYRHFNSAWFEPFGLNPDNLRIILSPSAGRNGFAAWRYTDTTVGHISYESFMKFSYAARPSDLRQLITLFINHYRKTTLRHNAAFDNTLIYSSVPNPQEAYFELPLNFIIQEAIGFFVGDVSESLGLSRDYVGKALEILYLAENTGLGLEDLLEAAEEQGFYNINEAYDALLEYINSLR